MVLLAMTSDQPLLQSIVCITARFYGNKRQQVEWERVKKKREMETHHTVAILEKKIVIKKI